MMNIDVILSSLGWAALHSVWQGFLAAGLVYAGRSLFRRSGASLRYSFQFLCLFTCFAAFTVTFFMYALAGAGAGTSLTETVTFSQIVQLGQGTAIPAAETSSSLNYSALLHRYSPLLGTIWFLGFLLVSARSAVSFHMTQILRKKGLSQAPEAWKARFRLLATNAGLTRMAEIFVSNRISGPIAMGFFKPVVLVPASFFTQLPQDQIEAVLLHEIAHIRRHDYLLNIFQTAIKAVFFYHPGIHYVSRCINEDREYACDDYSAAETKNPRALAMALAALRLSHPENSFAMAASGKNSPLMARLHRLIGPAPKKTERGQFTVPVIALALSAAFYLSITPLSEAHPEPKTDKNYKHAKHKLHNYKFKTTRIDGKPVTVKVTEDGRQWVLHDGIWYDVDSKKNKAILEGSGILDYNPMPPTPPKPPTPPTHYGDMSDKATQKAFEKQMIKFEKQMDQFGIDMEYFEHSMDAWGQEFGNTFSEAYSDAYSDKYMTGKDMEALAENHNTTTHRAEAMRERMLERAEAQREAALERAEEQREKAEEQREAAEERREAAKEQHEAAMERAEEHRERAMERAERIRERAMERAERERERAMERAEHKREKLHIDHETFKTSLMSLLKEDGVVSTMNEKVTLKYTDGHWSANGSRLPAKSQEKYCELLSKNNIKKSKNTIIKIKPESLHIETKSGKQSHKVTYGTFEFGDEDTTQNDKSWKEGSNQINFIHPTSAATITSTFGYLPEGKTTAHNGIDFAAKLESDIMASADGIIVKAATDGNYGKVVEIEHPNGYQSVYAHMNKVCVSKGDTVSAGQIVGRLGSTGKTANPHLHFEIRKDGEAVDPASIIPTI